MKKAILQAALFGLWATAATAHSPLIGTIPAPNATVLKMPDTVEMQFQGNIRLTRVEISHNDTHRMQMDLGDQTSFTQSFKLPMQDMGAGVYVIDWRGLGDDGHALNGSFSFTVE